jgi:membrane-associated phospholipid phosphatase
MKRIPIFFALLSACYHCFAQPAFRVEHALRISEIKKESDPVYKLKSAVDIPLTAAAAGFSIYGFSKIYSKDATPERDILQLNKADLNGFDRWAAGLHSQKAADVSDLFFYGAMPVPLLLLADKDIRSDAPKIAFLYLQAMSLTGVLYTGVPLLVDRYRPLTYSSEVPMDERISGNNRNSFFAGHVALVGTSTFFAAKVFSDYHPDSKLKYVFWGAAAVATGTTGYLRHRGGKHFPSDIVVGTAVGTLSGILVPQLHKTKLVKNHNLTILPFSGRSHGLAMIYRL